MPKSINFKRVYSMLGTKEKDATRVLLNFFNSLIPVFEEFLLLFQKSSPVIHILYESTCEILSKLLRRFVQSGEVDGKYGVALGSIDCKDVKLQLTLLLVMPREKHSKNYHQSSGGTQCLESVLFSVLQQATYSRSYHWATRY